MAIQYVNVKGIKDDYGTIIPQQLIWPDGRSWKIKGVLHTSRAPAEEYKGIRYTVLIGEVERYVYRDQRNRWYVITDDGEGS